MTFRPTPQLAKATVAALQTFSRHRPRVGSFRLFLENGDDAWAITCDWARALLGVSLEAIPEAATRWVIECPQIPNPATFAAYARKLDRAEFLSRDRLDLEQPAVARATVSRADHLQRRAMAALGSWQLAGEVWQQLIDGAATDVERQAVRDGHVTDAAFEQTLQAVIARREPSAIRTPLAVVA